MTQESQFKFRSISDLPEGLMTFKATFDRNNSPKTIEHLRWQFEQAPVRKQFVNLAFPARENPHEGVAGIYAVFPTTAKIGHSKRLCVQSLDTLTDSQFRGRGLFVKLAGSVYQRCSEQGVALVYGFPNAHSAPGFFGRLGWSRLDPVPFLIKPLRLSYFLRRLGVQNDPAAAPTATIPFAVRKVAVPVGDQLRSLDKFGPGTDRVWESFRLGASVAVERDAEYLNWRFTQRPGQRYRSWEYVKQNGESAGFVTVCCLDKHGGRVGYIMELLHYPGEPTVGRILLRHAVARLADEGAEVVLAWNLAHSSNHEAFRKTGFFALPEKLRPIELHFGALALDPSVTGLVTDRGGWYLSYSDSDTV